MTTKWTKEQLQAINATDRGIIVSAAAGSGKTSVLVERLIRQISSEDKKIPADRIVVVTFTNDAASEMKLRLITALNQQIENDPENEWLSSQQSLIQNANISTIHSFCFNLIRDNMKMLDLSSDFRVIDQNEDDLLISDVINQVIEELCIADKDKMTRLTDFFCTKGISGLSTTIYSVYKFIISIPYFEDWINKQIDKYSGEICDNSFIEQYFQYICFALKNIESSCDYASHLCDEIDQTTASETIQSEHDKVHDIYDFIANSNNSLEMRLCYLNKDIFETLRFKKVDKDSEEKLIIEDIKKIRDKYKKKFNKCKSEYLFTIDQLKEDNKVTRIILADLFDVVYKVDSMLTQLKNEKNVVSFSDAERYSIRLLSYKDENGKILKSKLADELSNYYKIIMIDEFQDANDSQDLIFKMLSHNGNSDNYGDNVFAVGDVKQSIYRFRLANPKIFIKTMENSQKYKEQDGEKNSYIKLNKNFRSSEQVVNFVNFIFSSLMSKDVGEVNYDKDEELVLGSDLCVSNTETEILLIDDCCEETSDSEKNETDNTGDEEEKENIEELNKEAKAVAIQIKSMLNDGCKVEDKGIQRPCVPSDFCILLRSKICSELFSKALNRYGILANTDEISGYLKSREIDVLINILKIIDNPLLDIPLASVMMSSIFAFTYEEISAIRLYSKDKSLYKALCYSVGILSDESVPEPDKNASYYIKAIDFYKSLQDFRMMSTGFTVEKLIRYIYDSTDFLSVVQLYKDGEQKKANLKLLLKYAKDYDNNNGGGLSGFIRYINSILSSGGDLQKASLVVADENVVSVKTIHKSKGLEYPFVFLCRTSTKFNKQDLNKQIQFSAEDGIAFKIQDKKNMKRYVSLPYLSVREQNKKYSLSEELRLLYVALTRAKQKLFISFNIDEKVKNKMKSISENIISNGKINVDTISSAESMQEWLMMCLIHHKDADKLRQICDVNVDVMFSNNVGIIFKDINNVNKFELNDEKEYKLDCKKIDDDIKIIEGNLSDQTHNPDILLSKMSVTELSKSESEIVLSTPKFLNEKKIVSGAEKGTAIHTFMQYADYSKASQDVVKEIQRLYMSGMLTKAQTECISLDKLKKFFTSELYFRMQKSSEVMRERKFLVKIDDLKIGEEFLSQYNGKDTMVQGIADCIFEEDGQYILVDYKTDYIKYEQELIDKYKNQLIIYDYALNTVLPKKIKEMYFYSFSLGKPIKFIKNP